MRRYFPASGMKHSQDDLLGEVMRKKRHCPDPSGSKQNPSRHRDRVDLYFQMV